MSDKEKLEELNRKIGELNRERNALSEKIRAEKAATVIDALGIKLEDVELSESEGLPRFGVVYKFQEWIKENSQKIYYEWSEDVYQVGSFGRPICNLDDLAGENDET